MTVTNQNASIYRGDTAALLVTLTMANGTPYDPEIGAELKYRISRDWHTPEADNLVSKGLGTGITVVGNLATIDLLETDTDLDPGVYHHELKIIDPVAVDVATAMTGTVVIKRAMNMVVPTP